MGLSIDLFVSALKQYEIKNNFSISLMLESDGSGNLCHYSSGESFFQFDTTDELFSYLKRKN